MCKYCEGKTVFENKQIPSISTVYEWDEATEVKILPITEGDRVVKHDIEVDAPDGDVLIDINFCPMCGRKLDRKDD